MDRRLLLVVLLPACALPDPPSSGVHSHNSMDGAGIDHGLDAGVASGDLAAVADFALGFNPPDLSTHDLATPDLAHPDLAMPPDLAPALDLTGHTGCVPRINEVMTGAPSQATAEFVELYNPCSTAIDLSGWKLVYRAGNNVSTAWGVDSSTLFDFASGTKISSKQFLLYAGSAISSKDGPLASSLKDGDGAVGLRDGSGVLVDSVGYGSVDPANAFIRGSAAPAPPIVLGGGSIGRIPDGHDSGNNALDFRVTSQTTPGWGNF
jgi:hypothetical protein